MEMSEKTIRRMPLPLSPENPLHARALKIIEGIPKGKRTEFICKKICAGEDEEISLSLKNAIYECVKKAIRDQGGVTVQPTVTEVVTPTVTDDERDEIDRNFFGFLASLED